MEEIKTKLNQITNAWNYYFLNYKECNRHIRFDEEVRTNYYGDILAYFEDTLQILASVEYVKNFNESIVQSVGLLQIVYVQQDLIDELLYIFKLQKSGGENKTVNRTIRNELIGHPIRRANNKLVSSVFYGNELGGGKLNYVLYTFADRFKGKSVNHHFDEILSRHEAFLNEYLDKVIQKITQILNKYGKCLTALQQNIEKGIDFKNILRLCSHYFEQIFKEDPAYTEEYLLFCDSMTEQHPRYLEFKLKFLKTLEEYLAEKVGDIPTLFAPREQRDTHGESNIKIEIIFTEGNQGAIQLAKKERKNYNYEYSKLYESHPIFGLDYFKRQFRKDNELLAEILHLERNQNTPEFYCSVSYIGKLLKDRKLLKTY